MVAAEMKLPRMGLGMAALGRPGYINLSRSEALGGAGRSVDAMQRASNDVIDALFGLTDRPWLDCARSYGLSEKFVGEYLRDRNVDPKSVYVSSKWGYSKWQHHLTAHVDCLFCTTTKSLGFR